MQNIRVANGHTKKLKKDVPKDKRKSSDAKTPNRPHGPGSNPDLP